MAVKQRTKGAPVRPQPHRFRVSVPVADEAVLEWMKLQDDQSLSVRMLIRESIERNGYQDVVNRPVTQLPKRGRPSGADVDQDLDEGTAAFSTADGPAAAESAGVAIEVPHEPADEPATHQDEVQSVSPPQDLTTTSASVHVQPLEAEPDEPEQTPSAPQDVNDIFNLVR